MWLEKEIKDRLPESIMTVLRRVYLMIIWPFFRVRYSYLYGHADFFSDLNIEINTSCNRRCQYCPNSVYDRGLIKNEKLMEEGVFRKIIDELAEIKFNGRISPQFYGEPLLDARLVGFMEYAKKKLPKAKIIIISNGDYLTSELFKKLTDIGVEEFLLTQHDRTMSANMKILIAFLTNNPTQKKKVKYLHFKENTPLFNRGGLIKPNVPLNSPRCAYPRNPLVIDYSGDVVLCCNDYLKSVVFGNIKNHKLTEIWFSKRYSDMRKKLRNLEFSLPICKKCQGIGSD